MKNTKLIIFISLFTPALIMLLVSVIWPVYFYRPIQPLVYLLCLFIAIAIAPGRKWYTWIGVVIWTGILAVSFIRFDPDIRGGHIDQAAQVIDSNWQDGDLILYVTPLTAFPFDYYLHDKPRCILDMPIGLNLGPAVIRGFDMCPLDTLRTRRTWLVWIREPMVPASIHAALEQETAGLTPLVTTDAWQFAKIEVYLIP